MAERARAWLSNAPPFSSGVSSSVVVKLNVDGSRCHRRLEAGSGGWSGAGTRCSLLLLPILLGESVDNSWTCRDNVLRGATKASAADAVRASRDVE